MIPEIPIIEDGSHQVYFAGAFWSPITCNTHQEQGFTSNCQSCVINANNTIDHMSSHRIELIKAEK